MNYELCIVNCFVFVFVFVSTQQVSSSTQRRKGSKTAEPTKEKDIDLKIVFRMKKVVYSLNGWQDFEKNFSFSFSDTIVYIIDMNFLSDVAEKAYFCTTKERKQQNSIG